MLVIPLTMAIVAWIAAWLAIWVLPTPALQPVELHNFYMGALVPCAVIILSFVQPVPLPHIAPNARQGPSSMPVIAVSRGALTAM